MRLLDTATSIAVFFRVISLSYVLAIEVGSEADEAAGGPLLFDNDPLRLLFYAAARPPTGKKRLFSIIVATTRRSMHILVINNPSWEQPRPQTGGSGSLTGLESLAGWCGNNA